MNYNQNILKYLVDFIKPILNRIEIGSDEEVSIKFDKYQVVESNNLDINYLTSNGLTGSFTMRCYFKVTKSDGVTELIDDLDIPKLINNVFVIEGALRVPTNTLDNDSSVTVYSQNIRINERINITFEYDEHEQGGYKIVCNLYDDDEPITFDLTDELASKYSSDLKLADFEIDKLKVKLDTDDIPPTITRDLVLKLIELGPDKSHDNLIDKKIYSPESNFMKYLRSYEVKRKIIHGMKIKYYQYGKIFLKDIQNAINRYFKVASESNIDIPTTVNPLVFDALKYKVSISKNVAYNKSMSDIIDLVNTPINSNTNKINELNVCAEIIDDVIHIKCYEYPSLKKVTVPYSHYCTKKVLVNQYWDYDANQLKTPGVFKYKLRMNIYDGTGSLDDITYIEPKADDKLSLTTRRIPLINMSDFGRLAMGTGMSKQAVELANSEPSYVTTGHDNDDFELSTLITKHSGPECIVTKIKDNKIYLKDSNGSIRFVDIPAPTVGQNNSLISFDTPLSVGSKVKTGDNLVIPKMLLRKSFELGLNSTCIYMNYLGYTHEDGVVISESYAKRLTHYALLDVVTPLRPDDLIKYIRKVGSKVTSKDVLVNCQTRLRVSKSVKDVYTGTGGLLQGLGIQFSQNNLIVPNLVDEGYVVSVKIHIEEGRDLTSEESKKVIDEFLKEPPSTDYDHIPDKYKSLEAVPMEISDTMSGYISYKILKVDSAKPGDKVCNRYGSKGEISLILPDECMPRICPDKNIETGTPAEIILNPAAVIARKNISQLYEAAMGKCLQKIYNQVTEWITQGKDIKSILEYLHVFYGSKFDSYNMKSLTELINEKGIYAFRFEVGCFAKVSYDQLLNWMKFLNITDTDPIYCPDVTIVETKSGLKGFVPSKYVPSELDSNVKTYELGWCEKPSITGNEYMMKLFHSAAYSGKVTSELMDSPEPVMGRGRWRDVGQKISEMELWVLMEYGTERFVQSQSESMISSQYIFLNELLLAGYTITSDDNIPLLSPYGDKLRKLKELENLN